MATNNPMVGGPDYARWLAETVSPRKRPGLATAPPASGGAQISIRLRPDRLRLLDTLSVRSGWSRNQVIEGLLDCGLATFFHHVDDAISEDLMEAALPEALKNAIIFPNQNPVVTSNRTVSFQAVVAGIVVECAISWEALKDHFGATTNKPPDLIRAFISGKKDILNVARIKLPSSAGRCLLVSTDF
jgi:hypothetical protein